MNSYENLANAIVEQAVKDYRKAQRKLRKHPENAKARSRIVEVETFFHSAWFKALTRADPDYILSRLQKEAH